MESLFKKFLYTGVGFVSLAADKFQKAVDELVTDGKLSEEEGKKIVGDFFKSSDGAKNDFDSQMNQTIDSIIKSISFATKQDIEKLKNRVAILENLAGKTPENE